MSVIGSQARRASAAARLIAGSARMRSATRAARASRPWVMLLSVVICASALAGGSSPLLRDRPPTQRPQLLIVGVAHFDSPARDLVNTEVADVLESRRQQELTHLTDRLAAYGPTHVVVEWPKSRQSELDTRYGEFRAGRYALGRSEVDQIGVRLAARAGLAAVHAVDWNGFPPGDIAEYDWHAYAKATDQGDRVEAIRAPTSSRDVQPLREQPLEQWLLELNAPASLANKHRVYFDYVMFGDDTRQPGSNWVGHWYARNLRIFSNLVRLSSDPMAHIVMVYGVGHAYLLRQFAQESGAFTVVDLREVLAVPH